MPEMSVQSFKTTQLMIKSDYELFHYREPYFKSLDFHTHDFYEIYLFLDGSVTYYVEDKAYDLIAGDLMLIPPQKMHRPVISNEHNVYERMVMWINSGFLNELDTDGALKEAFINKTAKTGFLFSPSKEKLEFFLVLLKSISEVRSERAEYKKAMITTLLNSVADEIERADATTRSEESQELIPSVIRYINEHFTEQINLDLLSERFYITKFYLLRRFKEYTNSTIYDYVLEKRISLARRLIRQGASAASAGEQCGFSDYSSFYRAFCAKTKLSPSAFKKESKCETAASENKSIDKLF